MKLYSSPASSPPIFQFLMKRGIDGNAISTHYGPYEHVYDNFSHEPWMLDNVTEVVNVGSPSVIRIGYVKRTKNQSDDDDCEVVYGNKGVYTSPLRWANPLHDVKNARHYCAEGTSITKLLYHIGEMTLYCSILLSMN